MEKLATPMILGSNYVDNHIEAIKPRKCSVEMSNEEIFPIIFNPSAIYSAARNLPEKKQYVLNKGRILNKIKPVTLQLDTETWVPVRCKKAGLIIIEPNERLYTNHSLIWMNLVARVQQMEPFQILISIFEKHPRMLIEGQVVPHPTSMTSSDFFHPDAPGFDH